MKKRILTILQYSLFLGLGIFLIWLSVKDFEAEQWNTLWDSFRKADYRWIVLSMVLALLSHSSRAMRWQMLIEPFAPRPTFKNAFMATMVGYFANLAFPRLGEVTRCGAIAKYEQVPFGKAFGTVVTERVIDVLLLLAITVITVVTQFHVLGDFFMEKVANPLTVKLSSLIAAKNLLYNLALVAGALLFLGIAYFILRNFRETALYRRIMRFIIGIWQGVKSVSKVKNIPLFIFHSLFIWFMYFVMIYVCFFAIPATTGLGAGVGLAVLAFGSFGFIATQGGIGAYQLFVAGLLVLYGIQYDVAYGFSWLIWAGQIGMTLIVGFASLVLMPILNKKANVSTINDSSASVSEQQLNG